MAPPDTGTSTGVKIAVAAVVGAGVLGALALMKGKKGGKKSKR